VETVTPNSTESGLLIGVDLFPSLIAKRDQGPECPFDFRFRKAGLFESLPLSLEDLPGLLKAISGVFVFGLSANHRSWMKGRRGL
jgi:hypothetical protein